MYSCLPQTGQYTIPYHTAPLSANEQKNRFYVPVGVPYAAYYEVGRDIHKGRRY